MAIPVMQFPDVQVPKDPNGLMSGIQAGLTMYSQLMNAKNQSRQSKAQQSLMEAQAKKAQQYQYGSPQGKGMADLQHLIDTYGEDSPQVNMYKDQLAQSMDLSQKRGNYYDTLASSMGLRYTPTTVREQAAAHMGDQGVTSENIPGQFQQMAQGQAPSYQQGEGGMPPNPEDQARAAQESGILKSALERKAIPVDVQKRQYAGDRVKVAVNMLDDFVDQGALDYTGTKGKMQLQKDKMAATLTGKVSPKYEAYLNFDSQLTAAKSDVATMMAVPADQLSRGDLGYLFDYNKFSSNPEVAKRQYNNTKKLLSSSEKVNYKTLNELAAENKRMGEMADKGQSSGAMQKIKAPNGKEYTVEELKRIAAGG